MFGSDAQKATKHFCLIFGLNFAGRLKKMARKQTNEWVGDK